MQRAAELQESEHLLSAYASWAARDSVAQFLGFCDVVRATSRLSKGLWLVSDSSSWAGTSEPKPLNMLLLRSVGTQLARDSVTSR